jgi:hypothetical protein
VTAWAFTGLTAVLGLSLGAVAAVGAVLAALWAGVAVALGRQYRRCSRTDDGSGNPVPVTD